MVPPQNLFLLTAILWIPGPYRLTREGFTTEFTLKALDESPAKQQEDAAAAAADDGPIPAPAETPAPAAGHEKSDQEKFNECILRANCWSRGGHMQIPNHPAGMCARGCLRSQNIALCSSSVMDFIECQ